MMEAKSLSAVFKLYYERPNLPAGHQTRQKRNIIVRVLGDQALFVAHVVIGEPLEMI